jgi:MFS family permease
MTQQTLAPVSSPAPARTGTTPAPAGRGFGPAALGTLLVGAFLPILSFFIVNVALPAIGSDLHASPAALELVVGSYGIANACLVVVGGRLGDALGRRRLFVLGLIGFAVFSLLCALAPSIGVLLAARVGQGAFAAFMTPQVLATIAHTLTGEARARAVGLYGAVGGVAAALGQILGGVLVSADLAGTGWRSVFLLNVPIALAAVAAAGRLIPETRSGGRLSVDLGGAGLLAAGLVALLLPVSEGRALGWPAWTWGALVAVLPLAGLLGAHQSRAERRGRVPLVPPSVLALPGMRVGLGIAVVFFAGFGGFMFAFSLALQGGAGLSALACGLALLPFALGFLAASVAGPRVESRLGARVITLGSAVQALGFALLAVTALVLWPDVTPLRLAPAMLVAGLGQGLVMMPLFGVVLRTVPVSQAGLGSGILITTQQTCLALGAAMVGTGYLALAGWYGVGAAFGLVAAGVAVASLVVLALSLRLSRSV